MGGLSFLAAGFVIGVAIAWVLPAVRAAGQTEKPAGEPDPDAGPKNDQLSPVKLDADDAVRVRDDGAGDDPTGYGTALDFFESKGFGASFGGLVSIVTLQMAGASARSTFALTLLIVAGYWLAFDKHPVERSAHSLDALNARSQRGSTGSGAPSGTGHAHKDDRNGPPL